MKILTFLFTFSVLFGSSWSFIGDNSNKTLTAIESKNSIVWMNVDTNWFASKPQDNLNLSNITNKNSGYVLINNDEIDYTTPNYTKDIYALKEGWNYLHSASNGVDVLRTFTKDSGVEFVYVYEKLAHVWAGYSPQKSSMDKLEDTRILSLKYIEPNLGFYVYASEDTTVDIKSTQVNKQCQKMLDDSKFESVLDSGGDKELVYNETKSIGIASRYYPHHVKGIYKDTRVLLIYPKLKELNKNKNMFGYGPAIPKTSMKFNKAYEGKTFYIYDYHTKECYEGILPSPKIPPFGALKKLK